eukprot:12757054-Alexandrium_andersonii.AAC.1
MILSCHARSEAPGQDLYTLSGQFGVAPVCKTRLCGCLDGPVQGRCPGGVLGSAQKAASGVQVCNRGACCSSAWA